MSKFEIAKQVAAAKRQRMWGEFKVMVLALSGVEEDGESLSKTANGGKGAGLMAYTKALWESVKDSFESQ
jgi:hypothetical protein